MSLISAPFGLLAFLHWNHNWNNHHFPESHLSKAIDQIAALGIQTLRIDILWSDVQKTDGSFNFDRYKNLFSAIRKRDIRILAILHYNKIAKDIKGKEKWNHPPDSFDEFAAYVHKTVSTFKTEIQFWEIWNEPNLEIYWNHPKDDLKLYSELLKKSYQAAKEADPACFVLNGGLTEPLLADVSNLYKQGCKEFFDILNIHTFINPLSAEPLCEFNNLLKGVFDQMKKAGDQNKKIWITEMGCPGIPSNRPSQNWFGGAAMTEEQQADWCEKIYRFILTVPYVEKLFWAFYRDVEGEFKDATDYFGLVRFDYTTKPAYQRLQSLIKQTKEKV